MTLKNHPYIKLPSLTGGSFSGLDRLLLPHNILILKKVTQRVDNGNIDIITRAKDGPEERSGPLRVLLDDRARKDFLYHWFQQQLGKDIETVYNSEFTFGDERICPRCSEILFLSMEPKVANLANKNSKFPPQNKQWRCSNSECNFREMV